MHELASCFCPYQLYPYDTLCTYGVKQLWCLDFFAPRASNRTHRVQSQAFCHRQMAAMRSIAAFGVVKRKCVGTRSRRSRRSIPVSHILYNVPTPGRRARRPRGVYGSRLGRMEDGGGKGMSCKTSISGISYVFTLFSIIVSLLPCFPV